MQDALKTSSPTRKTIKSFFSRVPDDLFRQISMNFYWTAKLSNAIQLYVVKVSSSEKYVVGQWCTNCMNLIK